MWEQASAFRTRMGSLPCTWQQVRVTEDHRTQLRNLASVAFAVAAAAECMGYPVPRLLDEATVVAILNQITG